MPHSYRPQRFLFPRWPLSVVLFALCMPAILCLASRPAQGQTFSTLYRFTGSGGDGGSPEAGLIMDGAGNLFGTTAYRGASGGGTIFELKCTSYNSTARSCQAYNATDTVLYSFTAYNGDAGMPEAGLILDGAGNLFGTTTYGGAINNGTIFELKCTSYNSTAHTCQVYNSTDTVLYSIPWSANNYEMPYSGLILDGAGNLYEATGTGGASDNGTVIELACTSYNSTSHSCQTYSSTGTVLYSFTGSGGDGAVPHASLTLDGAGNLFGTTEGGGEGDGGTIFELPCENYNASAQSCEAYSSTDTVLDSFYGSNGELPVGSLILDSSGNLFGTTAIGGATGNGTVFELACASYNASAQSCAAYNSTDTVLYNFTGFPANGANPAAGMFVNLEVDGTNPAAGLILDRAGNLFGTTLYGGGLYPDGTVFELPCASYIASTQSCERYSSSDVVIDLADFGGVYTYATPILDGSGNLFGTSFGYLSNQGTVFEVSGAAIASSGGGGSTTVQTIAFPDPGTQNVGGSPVTMSATASSGLAVTYTSNSTSVCTVSGDKGTMIAAGACSITASQPGNSTYAAATPVTDNFTVNATSLTSGQAFSTLYSFTASGGDGAGPYAGLVLDGAGNLFGTTFGGGSGGGGAIFKIACTNYSASTGSCQRYNSTDTLLYDFTWSGGDGAAPYAGLFLDGVGNLFGTTVWGGAHGYGTVFELACTNYNSSTQSCATYSSTDTVLYSFAGSAGDGAMPQAGLIMDGTGNLFGTTAEGGASGYGTTFELACASYSSPTGSCAKYSSTAQVLNSFTFTGGDGASPQAGLVIDRAGNLFGTTAAGGADLACAKGNLNNSSVCGTVFELACTSYNASAQSCNKYGTADTVLYSFGGGSPLSGLILDGAGNLFGTTSYSIGGSGDVFELTCTGYNASAHSCTTYSSTLTDLHGLGGLSDGGASSASLILDGAGNLFGTTISGGDQGCNGGDGCGAIIKLACTSYSASTQSCTKYSTSDTVLYSFTASGNDGAFPYASLILDGAGNLFGTASYAGASGYGTVFEESGAAMAISGTTVQTITFPNPGTQTVGGNPVILEATSNSGLSVTYASNTASVCTVSGGTATIVAAGTCSITTSQSGNSTYAAATPVTDTFTVSAAPAPSYSLAASANSATTTAGSSTSVTLTLSSANYTGTVGFAVSSSDSSAVSGSAPPVSFASSMNGSSTLTITTAAGAAIRRDPPAPWKGGDALIFFAVVLAAPFSGRRKARRALLFTVLAISLVAASLTACGGGGNSGGASQPPQSQTYTLTVTPTGSGTVTNAAPLVIQVTVD